MQLDEFYNFCLKNFSEHSLFTGVSEKNHDFGFYDFRNDNLIWDNFNCDIRNQPLKLRKYTLYQNNLNWKVFGTAA